MFSPESLHKPLPHFKRRRGSSPPKIGSGQVLKETSIYRVQWHSYFPERWLKEAEGSTSRGRVTPQGWVIGITQDEKSEDSGELYLWSRTGKETSTFSLAGLEESHLESAPDRVCPIFEGDEAGQLIGLVFVSSSGLVRFWSHYTNPQLFMGGEVPVTDAEYCTSLENAYVPHTLSLVCGTSLGRIFLLQCTDDSNNLCDAVVSEITRPQGVITRLFRFGQTNNAEVKRIISLQNFDASDDNGGTFVLTETGLSFWRLSANNAHSFIWEDKLSNVLVQYPGVRFLDVVCRTAESEPHELLVLCRAEDLCFVAVLDILDPTSKPQLARCVECTVPPRELDENLRVVSVEGNVMAAFIVGAISVTNVPFIAAEDREKDHVFNRLERKALSCLGGGVYDGAVYLLAEGYGMLTLQYMPPTADKHPRQQIDDEDEKKEVDTGVVDVPKRLETAFELFVDRTKTWEYKAQALLQQATPTLDLAVIAFTERLVQARPRTEYTATIDFAILRHHLIQKRTRYESWLQFLKHSMLWGERLSEHAQLSVLEFGEKLTIMERVWEAFQDSKDQDEKAVRDAFLQKLIERSNGAEDGLSAIEVFFSDALGIAKVILNLKSLLPAQEIQYGGSEKVHESLLQRYIMANACLEVILWQGLRFRQLHSHIAVVSPWTTEIEIYAALREHAHKSARVLQIVKSDEGLLKWRERLFDSCYRVFRGLLSQKPPSVRNNAEFEQDVSYLVGLLQQAAESLEGKELANDLVVSLAGEFLECNQLVYLCPVNSQRPMVTEGKEGRSSEDAIYWHCLKSAEGFYYVNSHTKQVTTIQPACFGDDNLVDFLRSRCSEQQSHNRHVTDSLIALLHWCRPRNLKKFTTALFTAYIDKRRLSAVALSVSDVLKAHARGMSGALPAYPFGGAATVTDTQAIAVFHGAAQQLLTEYDAFLRQYLVNWRDLAWVHAIHEKDFATCTTALLDSADELSSTQKNLRFNLAFLSSLVAPGGTECERLPLAKAQQYFSTASQSQKSGKRIRAAEGDARSALTPQQLFLELAALGTNTRDPQAVVHALDVYQILDAQNASPAAALATLWKEIYEVDQAEWENIAKARDNDLNGQLPDNLVRLTLFCQVLDALARKTGGAVLSTCLARPLKLLLEELDPPVRRAYELVLVQPVPE